MLSALVCSLASGLSITTSILLVLAAGAASAARAKLARLLLLYTPSRCESRMHIGYCNPELNR